MIADHPKNIRRLSVNLAGLLSLVEWNHLMSIPDIGVTYSRFVKPSIEGIDFWQEEADLS